MVDVAFKSFYRDEYVAGYERSKTMLVQTTLEQVIDRGKEAIFNVTLSNREAVTRGSNGLIPSAVGQETPIAVALSEWHDLPQTIDFDVIRAQIDERKKMREESYKVINRKRDALIIDQLATGTLSVGAVTPTTRMLSKMIATLRNNNVPGEDISVVLAPAALQALLEDPRFSSADYVAAKPLTMTPGYYSWQNLTIFDHTGLPKTGAVWTMFAYHKQAIGCAYVNGTMKAAIGYDEEQDYHWARASAFMGAGVLQNSGIVLATFDETDWIAT